MYEVQNINITKEWNTTRESGPFRNDYWPQWPVLNNWITDPTNYQKKDWIRLIPNIDNTTVGLRGSLDINYRNVIIGFDYIFKFGIEIKILNVYYCDFLQVYNQELKKKSTYYNDNDNDLRKYYPLYVYMCEPGYAIQQIKFQGDIVTILSNPVFKKVNFTKTDYIHIFLDFN